MNHPNALCTCGHTLSVHREKGVPWCTAQGCYCREWVPITEELVIDLEEHTQPLKLHPEWLAELTRGFEPRHDPEKLVEVAPDMWILPSSVVAVERAPDSSWARTRLTLRTGDTFTVDCAIVDALDRLGLR